VPAHDERELKFAPGPSFRLPDLSGVDGDASTRPTGTVHLHATYYDTRDLRLARAGASLRYRDDGGWTVKLPGDRGTVLSRREIEVTGPPDAPPVAALDLVTALARGAPVECVGRLNTVRDRTLLLAADGTELAEVVDDEVSVLQGVHLAARFRELEVELRPGAGDELVGELVRRLRQAGAGKPQTLPKIARALGPRAADPPDLVPPEELDEASTPAEILRASIAASAARLVAHDPGVRLGEDAEDVHQARVATRRLRSDLRTFGPVVDDEWADGLRGELQWIGGLLGAVRDTDVLLDRLHRHLGELPDADEAAGLRLLAGLHGHRDDARAGLLDAMRSRRYTDLLDRLVAAARRVPAVHGLRFPALRPEPLGLLELVALRDLGHRYQIPQWPLARTKTASAAFVTA